MIPALPTFMIFHFALSFLAPERQCLFHLARCRRASWQPQVTCVEATLTTIVKVLHRCINVARCSQVDQPCQVLFGQVAFRQPVQKPPSGSADFCDIRFECVSPFDCDVPTWLKVALFWELASKERTFSITFARLHLFACFHLKMLCECLKCPLPLQLIAKGCFTIHKIATVCRLSKTQKGELS